MNRKKIIVLVGNQCNINKPQRENWGENKYCAFN